jgi:hypothetical protein
MNRLNPTAVIVAGVVLLVLCVMGLLNAQHVGAKIMYACLTPCSLAAIVYGFTRRKAKRSTP